MIDGEQDCRCDGERSDPPPVGKLNKHTVVVLGIIADLVPQQVVVHAKKEHCARP